MLVVVLAENMYHKAANAVAMVEVEFLHLLVAVMEAMQHNTLAEAAAVVPMVLRAAMALLGL
jgi:hypothetical protein